MIHVARHSSSLLRSLSSFTNHATVRVGGVATPTLASTRSFRMSPTLLHSYYSTSTAPLPPKLGPPTTGVAADAPDQKKGFWSRVNTKYSLTAQQERVRRAERLFQAATRQASDPRWFGPGRISRDFRPRHALLTMHIWLLHKRLISDTAVDPQTALMVQEELFHILWDDTMCRIRQQGVYELAVNKHLLKVQQYTFLHLTHYDHCFTEYLQNPRARMQELRKIIVQHLLLSDPSSKTKTEGEEDSSTSEVLDKNPLVDSDDELGTAVSMDHLDRLAWYMEAQYQNIVMEWPDEYYRQGRVAWIDLPDFTNLRDREGNILEEKEVFQEDVLPEPWLRNITLRGKEYYWNPETMRSTWERPQ